MLYHSNGAPKLGVQVCFSAGGDNPGGGGTPPLGGTPPPNDPPGGDPPGEKTLTQAQVNAIVKKRAEDLTKAELGGLTLEDAKALIQKARAVEDAAKTETERAVEAAKKEARKQADEEWAAKLAAEKAASALTLIKAEVKTQAAGLNFHDPEDAWLRLQALTTGDTPTLVLDDKGNPTGVKEALDKLAKEKPYLVKTGDGSHLPNPPRNGGGGDDKAAADRMALGASEIVFGGRRTR